MDPHNFLWSSSLPTEEEEEEFHTPAVADFLFDRDRDTSHMQFVQSLASSVQEVGDTSRPRRGSVHGHQVVHRSRAEGHARLYADYFADNPVYDHRFFRRR